MSVPPHQQTKPPTKGKRCFVLECESDESTPGISFYRIPGDAEQRMTWLRFLELANESHKEYRTYSIISIKICSHHFRSDCFSKKGTRLKSSYPSIVNGKCLLAQLFPCPVKMEIVPRVVHPLQLWSTVIHLNQKICLYENEVLRLQQLLKQQQAEIGNYRKLNHVQQQKLKRLSQTAAKRKADTVQINAKRRKIHDHGVQTDPHLPDFGHTSSGTFLNEIQSRAINSKKQYSDFMKNISFELHFRSPSAYEFLRTTLDGKLPHSNTFGNWTKTVNAKPGIIPEALYFMNKLQSESKHKLYYGLMFDEIHIRQMTLSRGDRMYGFVDYGGLAEEPKDDRIAKTALFFLVNQINGNKKFPLAYVLANGLTKDVLSSIITNVLIAIHENANSKVLTVTCDGHPTNFAALEKLGADLDPRSSDFRPNFKHPISGDIIFVVLDPCHMYKLIRNVWKSVGTIYTTDGKKIDWAFLAKLHKLQQASGLRAANKLTNRHLTFENDKMKTKICVQTLSNSVSVALSVCRELKQDGFTNSADTEEFLAIFNRLFDTMNSRVRGKGYSTPLKQSSYLINKEWLISCQKYLTSLQIIENRQRKSLLSTKKSTGIKGLLITIQSLLDIMDSILINPTEDLQYLPVYKILQDHIETYFGAIRGRHGRNNNPNVDQLRFAVRDLLCIKIKDIVTGNCVPLEDSSAIVSPFQNIRTMLAETDEQNGLALNMDEELLPILNLESNLFTLNIVVYISGFVIRKLCAKLSCVKCICLLYPSEFEKPLLLDSQEYMLIARRDNGGLVTPAKSVVQVCKYAETSVRFWEQKGLKGLLKNSIISTSMRECVKARLGAVLCCGSVDDDIGGEFQLGITHGLALIKAICSEYVKVRLHHIAKMSTLRNNPISNRRKLTKLVHFSGN